MPYQWLRIHDISPCLSPGAIAHQQRDVLLHFCHSRKPQVEMTHGTEGLEKTSDTRPLSTYCLTTFLPSFELCARQDLDFAQLWLQVSLSLFKAKRS